MEPILLDVQRFSQPDGVTCGPTCLAKVYDYYGYEKPLDVIIAETPRNPDGGAYIAWSKIACGKPSAYENQASSVMRRINVDYARRGCTPAPVRRPGVASQSNVSTRS